MTAADKLNTSVTNGTKVLEAAEGLMRPGLNRRVIFMRKLEIGEGCQSEYSFEPPGEGEDMVQHTVALKRAILGPEADYKDLCVIELETKVDTGKVEKFPLAYLGLDKLQMPLEVFLSEAATIRIVKGKGPIYIMGEYAEEWRDDEPDEIEESCNEGDEEDLEESEDEQIVEGNKENGVGNGVRKRKLAKDNEGVTAKKLRQEDATETAAMDDQEKA